MIGLNTKYGFAFSKTNCLKWLKAGLHFLWNTCLSYPRQNISEDINSSWLNTEVIIGCGLGELF